MSRFISKKGNLRNISLVANFTDIMSHKLKGKVVIKAQVNGKNYICTYSLDFESFVKQCEEKST